MTVEERIRGRKIGVVGMARSGMAAARLALEMGGSPFVSDAAPQEKVRTQCDELSKLGIPFEIGAHTDRLLGCDYIVLSPGVPLSLQIIRRAKEKGLPVFSELEFASWVCPGRIVAVTGSNGKTTTTTLLGEMLTAGGLDVHVCGNIGRPFSDVVRKMSAESVAVVEVSSFQLETVDQFKPFAALVLNLTPDHIDRHGSFEAYCAAKWRITENQDETDLLVLNRDDKTIVAASPDTAARKLFFSIGPKNGNDVWVEQGKLWVRCGDEAQSVVTTAEIAIKGPHNLQNAAAAVAVAGQFKVAPDAMARVLRSFPGVEHRLERAATVAGVTFINDSKATNVDSVCWALRSVDTPVYLILGGRGKGAGYEPIAEAGRDKVKGIVVIGEAADEIIEALGKTFPAQYTETLEKAVNICFEMAHPGETVLLSPGCASFDMFENFEHRGRVFKAAVAELKNGKNTDEAVAGR